MSSLLSTDFFLLHSFLSLRYLPSSLPHILSLLKPLLILISLMFLGSEPAFTCYTVLSPLYPHSYDNDDTPLAHE